MLGKTPVDMPMVQYWKTQETVQAKITKGKHGETVMKMFGEDEIFPGYPRGYLLFGKLSKLKHEIKNQIFNDAWYALERGEKEEDVVRRIKDVVLPKIFELSEETRYDRTPPERMNPAVREIYRAWTKVAPGRKSIALRNILCFILQEDDAYRFRVQWLVTYFGWLRFFDPIKSLDRAFQWLEVAEVVDDMKERQRLLRRIVMLMLRDERMKKLFVAFFKECNWRKVKLTKADKFHFRGKYFKVDLDKFEY